MSEGLATSLRDRWRAEGGYRQVLRIAVPLILSTSAWSIQHFVDRMFLTWHSQAAVAAAMPAGMLNFALMTVFMGTAGYAATFVAQYHGAGRDERVGPAVWQGVYVGLVGGGVVALAALLAGPVFRALGHAPEVCANEIVYFRILCLGATPPLVNSALSGFFSGLGRTWTVMWVNAAATGVNLVLDYVLIFGWREVPAMGIGGAALATVASALVSLALYALLLSRPALERRYRTLSGWRPDADLLRRLLRFGGPSGAQFFLDVAGFAVFMLILATLRTEALAASNIAFNINTLAFMPMFGIGTAVSVLVGQYLGAQKPSLAERSTYSGFHLVMAYMGAIAAAYVVLPGVFVGPFLARMAPMEAQTLRATVTVLLRFVAFYSLFDSMNIVFASALRGAGDTRFVMVMLGFVSLGALVLPSAVGLLVLGGGLYTAWCIATAYVIVLGFSFLFRFLAGRWKAMRVIEEMPPVLPPAMPESPSVEAGP